MLSQKVVIKNDSGLHMRPAGLFVNQAKSYKSDVMFEVRGEEFNAKSIMKVLAASVKNNDEIEIRVEGEDEVEALAGMVAAVEGGLGE